MPGLDWIGLEHIRFLRICHDDQSICSLYGLSRKEFESEHLVCCSVINIRE
jgi:hypothetical protein